MNHCHWLPLVTVLIAAPAIFGATKEQDLPDKEMLKMIEFLREIEIIKQQEMLRELNRAELLRGPAKSSPPPKPALAKQSEVSK